MKWLFKPWMGSRQTRLSRNSPFRWVGWTGGRTVARVAVLKVKGCWILAESRHAGWGRLTFCICPSIHPQKNPHWSSLWILSNHCVGFCLLFFSFFLKRRLLHTTGATCRLQLYSMTWWPQCGIITSRRWGGRFFWHVLSIGFSFFYCTSEGDCCLDGAVCVGGGGDQQLQEDMPATTWLVTSLFIFIFLTIVFYIDK